MPIKSTLYVNITSGVVGADYVAVQELTGRRFSTSPFIPSNTIVRVFQGGAQSYFGASSPEAVFASQYFSYVSPAPVSRPNNLQFAAYAPSGRAPALFGGSEHATLAEFQAVTSGALDIYLGDNELQLSDLDLSEVTSFADVSTAIQSAIRTDGIANPQYATAIVLYNAVTGVFSITGGVIETARAGYAVTTGTDIGAMMGLGGAGSIESDGLDAQSPLQAFLKAEQVSDSFGSATFSDLGVTLPQAKELALYVKGENVKYQIYFSVSRANYQEWYDELSAIGSTGLILNATAGEYKESLPMAIMAATDYDRRNATVNYMFRQSALSFDVNTTDEALLLNARRINYYGNTAVAGQQIRFFQRGFLMGGATDPLDMNVHANEQWLKAAAAAALLSMQLALNKIPANDDGRGYILVQLADLIAQAKFNGTISVGKTLTTLQKVAITQLTGDSDAWQAVQTNGVWYDVVIVPVVQTSGVTEYVAKYTIAYSKNDVVRTIEGSHNLV